MVSLRQARVGLASVWLPTLCSLPPTYREPTSVQLVCLILLQ